MDRNELMGILQSQAILGRTQDGWDLGKGMPEASSSSIADMGKEDFLAEECLNCKFVSSAEFFSAGCPNCGCKDHKTLE
jgi:predicted nucleic-acid-binding Zn-ribbon protein